MCLILYIFVLTGNLIFFFSRQNTIATRLNFWAATSLPRNGMDKQADKVFQYILQRPQYSSNNTYINYARLLLDLEQDAKASEILSQVLLKYKSLEIYNHKEPRSLRKIAENLIEPIIS